jgi:hypothetical protein
VQSCVSTRLSVTSAWRQMCACVGGCDQCPTVTECWMWVSLWLLGVHSMAGLVLTGSWWDSCSILLQVEHFKAAIAC